ncbi:MAG: nuclear transport factor 2 family protein [Gammaproteobacteria bacterium]|nr:MAG: nuclear transport factor 2 family protein [Gammaproteobacteria bacterium]
MAAYPREELEEMMRRWLKANRDAEAEGNWSKHLGQFYTDDAVYRWNIGPNEEFWARGRKEIEDVALGFQMHGFEDWAYDYDDVIIDEKRGEVIGMWRQVAPFKRPDGSNYEVAGVGGSWFRYAGNYKWEWQRDFFDLGNVKALFFELAGDGKLNPVVRDKIHRQAKGELLPGHEKIRPEPGKMKKLRDFMAMIRIAIFG